MKTSSTASEAVSKARRLCFMAHHDINDIVDPYVLNYLSELRDAGFTTVLVSVSKLPEYELRKLDALCAEVILRENVGLDFGGWVECFARYPQLSADLLLLCNDSVYGPFWKLSTFIEELTEKPADFYGAVLSLASGACPMHLQSWFLLFRPQAFRSRAFADVLKPVPAELSKADIIRRYECRLTQALSNAGLQFRAAFDPREHGTLLTRHYFDPMFTFWREQLSLRIIPFLKVSLVRDRPSGLGNLRRWHAIAHELNPVAADLAQQNAERRRKARQRPALERLRSLAFVFSLGTARTPLGRALLVADLKRRRSSSRAWLPGPAFWFGALHLVSSAVLGPYRAAYGLGSRLRRWRIGKPGPS